jgi:hypothetical protein
MRMLSTSLIVFLIGLVLGLTGCTGGDDFGMTPEPHSDWEDMIDEGGELAVVMSKTLVPTKLTAVGTELMIDAPEGTEIEDTAYIEIVYPYVIQIKVIEALDLAAAKQEAMKKKGFKEVVTDGDTRLVVLNDSSGSDEYTFWINKQLGDQTFTLTTDGRGWVPGTSEHLNWAMKIADSVRLANE